MYMYIYIERERKREMYKSVHSIFKYFYAAFLSRGIKLFDNDYFWLYVLSFKRDIKIRRGNAYKLYNEQWRERRGFSIWCLDHLAITYTGPIEEVCARSTK